VRTLLRNGSIELLPGKGRQSYSFDELVLLISEDAKEIHDLPVNIIVRLERRGLSVEQDGG
jgi:hypothetical protein